MEDIVGAPVTAFSYPQGAFSAVARAALPDTGYRLGRSTTAFRTACEFDPLLRPISLEFCPYSIIFVHDPTRGTSWYDPSQWAAATWKPAVAGRRSKRLTNWGRNQATSANVAARRVNRRGLPGCLCRSPLSPLLATATK